ncbi:MAG: outer membrane lipid asymmetry maintenance protein MlaD [Hyphomicrobiales bacterium]|nr:MAG: outer membrane lipid asymmetry maintenance protein MlaD [Hyphomicrobiales bacterium]
MKSSLVETLVGASVILIAGLFLYYMYSSTGQSAGSGYYSITAEFDRVDGLPVGADVRLAGIKVGSVIGQKLDQENYRAIVSFAIAKGIKLPKDTNAKIASKGLLGGSYITLDPGGDEELLAEGGHIVYTQSSIDLMSLIGKAIFNSDKK